ncbi:MAG: hypothetical protein QNJ46_32985 [Leptolyngbyaceae cyanobacterium MO_188.B28]|nr:hypothetical protein [Leptolyngbyaceae cyanobacterium MO_188.B28]
MGQNRKQGWKTQEVRVFFSQKNENEFTFQTEYVKDFCDWNLNDFVEFVQAQASQGCARCFFMIRDERNHKALQRLNAEVALRGIQLPIPVKVVNAIKDAFPEPFFQDLS